jgi:hypothetical protein
VKVALKQLFYAIGEPPGILLSLLPAPQQAIMSCKYDSALKSVYGDDVKVYNEMTNFDNSRNEEDVVNGIESEDDFYDDFENYDNEDY